MSQVMEERARAGLAEAEEHVRLFFKGSSNQGVSFTTDFKTVPVTMSIDLELEHLVKGVMLAFL
eukprot:519670-Rhodomonas_salina.4